MTGPVHTGKTTALARLVARYPSDFVGILAPVIDGQRYLRDSSTGETRCLENPVNAKDALPVGPYVFSRSVFGWARQRLAQQAELFPDRWLIIDELGKLELRGEGLAPEATAIITHREERVIVVVRDSLLASWSSVLGTRYSMVRRDQLGMMFSQK